MPQKDTLKRFGRMLSLLAKLDQGRIHLPSLTGEFKRSKRQLQRDIATLHKVGFYIIAEAQPGWYRFADGISLKNRILTNDQHAALLAMASFAKNMGAGISESFDKLFLQLTSEALWGNSYIVPIMPKIKTDTIPYIKDIEYAIEYSKEIEIEYVGGEGGEVVKHHICPLRVLVSEGFAYIFSAYKTKPGIFPKYRIDRIKKLTVIDGDSFREPEGVEEALAKARSVWGTMMDKHRKIKVRLKVDSWARDYFLRQDLVGGQTVRECSDGSLIYEAAICQLPEITPHILRWIPNVTVISPKELKDEILKKIAEFKAKQK